MVFQLITYLVFTEVLPHVEYTIMGKGQRVVPIFKWLLAFGHALQP